MCESTGDSTPQQCIAPDDGMLPHPALLHTTSQPGATDAAPPAPTSARSRKCAGGGSMEGAQGGRCTAASSDAASGALSVQHPRPAAKAFRLTCGWGTSDHPSTAGVPTAEGAPRFGCQCFHTSEQPWPRSSLVAPTHLLPSFLDEFHS